jgi:hypothetical protein
MTWIAIRQLLGAHWLIIGLASAAVVSVIGWDNSRKAQWVQRGVQNERASVEKRGEINARKAEDARRSVERLPDDRLRDRWFRD